ncbi:uncharacterized protein TNCV_4367801 [Trichonephila clavipes]|nr:uncharacterized protein TNCV_4367801 [Trichonephila clavipes]
MAPIPLATTCQGSKDRQLSTVRRTCPALFAHLPCFAAAVPVAPTTAVALSTIQETERFNSVSPQFKGRTPWGGQGPPTNLTRGLAARRLFKVPPCREGTIHLQTSMSSPGLEPSPNGTAVSVANHYTERKLDLTGASEMNRLYPNSRRESIKEDKYLNTLPRRGRMEEEAA